MKFWFRLLLAVCLIAVLAALPGSLTLTQAGSLRQTDPAQQKAKALLAKMTPAERVGQLFLITFQGSTFDEKSQIFDLITNQHVGGVVLLRSNDNFTAMDNIPAQAYALNRLLQETELKASQRTSANSAGNSNPAPKYVPLLIGVSQEGDDYPNNQILNGLSPLPDLMSIGATWNPTLAQQAGAQIGQELSALGFNLYLGPSLDVLDSPQSTTGEDLGVRTFGGDPYWVGKMGEAYIAGLHNGSNNQLMVISTHFPGRGSSDRSPDEEIATVRKSLDQLKQIELAPFSAVTGNAPDPNMVTDGLLVSHIRYQGFQGNIRVTTRPISSDSAALDQILKLQPFTQWRDKGGLLVSDNLGSQAVRRFYDPTGNSFDARTAAREAFLAGNDLLYMDRFVSTGDPDTYTTIVRTLGYFTQKYREDAVFAQRVDASVERILTLKYRLYPDFNETSIIPPATGLTDIGHSQQVAFDIARKSVTLISPDSVDLPNIMPRGPESRDRILFLTDVQLGKQCTNCPDQTILPVDALQSAVLRLYGPRTGGQVSQSLMSSYSFMDLWKLLNGVPNNVQPTAEPSAFENDLKLADWVVVSMLKPNSSQPESQAFSRLLSERPDLLRTKKVVVFAFNAPYYLDATDISKLTAYYAMYSKMPPFVEVAARILFQDLNPAGSLPVSVPGIGYDLIHATSPDPSQVISLLPDFPSSVGLPTRATQEPTAEPIYRLGDVISLRTGVIYDHNHNPVPDGTPVRYIFSVISESSGSTIQQVDTETVDGVARAMYRIDRPGLLEIHAAADQDTRSNLLRLDISAGTASRVTSVPPTPQPTDTPVPTPTITATVAPTATATPVPQPAAVNFQDWFFVFVLILGGAIGISWLGVRQAITRWGLRWALCGVIGGMLFYNFLALDLPGSQPILRDSGRTGILLFTLSGVLVGWGVGLIWRQVSLPGKRSAGGTTGERSATGPKSQSS